MLDRRARLLALVDERLHVSTAVREMEARAVAEHEQRVGRSFIRERAHVDVVRGGKDHDLVRARNAIADDRILVRNHPQMPSRRVGVAVAEARDLGWRAVLVATAEWTARDARR